MSGMATKRLARYARGFPAGLAAAMQPFCLGMKGPLTSLGFGPDATVRAKFEEPEESRAAWHAASGLFVLEHVAAQCVLFSGWCVQVTCLVQFYFGHPVYICDSWTVWPCQA